MMFTSKKSFISVLRGYALMVSAVVGMAVVPYVAQANIEPIPLASDPRVKTIVYAPDQVFKYTGYLRYQTTIEFGPDEIVQTILMGDNTGWKMNPAGNKLYIKPSDLDITTNMTLVTSKRTYLFELHADEVKNIDDKRLTFILRFVYPDEGDVGVVGISSTEGVPDLENDDLSKYNFRYSISGSEEVSPIRIFDDGEFTFFEFRGINADIPAFFRVLGDGSEELINYRTRGNYIVVERVSGRYTLRHGKEVVCVFNEAWGDKGFRDASENQGGWLSSNGTSSESSSKYRSSSTVK